jgi:hypothetical protein
MLKVPNRDDLVELYRVIEAGSFEFGLDGWGIHLLEPCNGFDETYTADFTLSRHWYSFAKRAEMMEKWPAWIDFLGQSGLPKKYSATISCNNSKPGVDKYFKLRFPQIAKQRLISFKRSK